MPEEKQRKKRIRVEKLDEWIETLKSIEESTVIPSISNKMQSHIWNNM